MGPEQRRLIEDLFEECLDRDPSERDAFLEEACPDPAVRREVRALVAAHEQPGLLELGPRRMAAALLDPYDAGDHIGPWRLVKELGRGGMAVVYMGERDDGQYRQRVAVKVIRGGGDPDELERRFRAERQILAALDHPNIARLLDGGLTEDRRPYLVMEYVNGLPIDDYCDRRRLGIDERLRLFCTVGRAVQHAHSRLVVHRDLKPSNILVKGADEVKLLDFGIAKILDPGAVAAETAPLTRTGMRLMTPEYASPEQVRGEAVSTANDVYALGVVLFELLAGRRPFRMEGKSLGECERMVIEEEPPRPSAIVTRPVRPGREDSPHTPTPELVARNRRTGPRRLRRRIQGDLDRIVLMALRKEPERRYRSVEQMVEDVERHLDGRTVRATGDSVAYRARKFVSRYRWAVASATLLVLTLSGGVVATAWQARRAAEQAVLASAARDRAEEQARKAARVSTLMVELFRLSDPAMTLGQSISAREVLDRGTERIENELEDEPDVQAQLLGEIAKVYANLGLLERAEELSRRALRLHIQISGPESLEAATAMAQVGDLLAGLGQGDAAVDLYRTSIAVRRSHGLPSDTALARTQARLAWQVRATGNDTAAGRLFEEALETQRTALGEDHPEVASTLLGLAATYHDEGRFDEAEALFQGVLEREDGSGGAEAHPLVATALLNVGMIRRLREQYISAEPLLRSGLAMREELYEPGHPEVVYALGEWGAELYELGRYEDARQAFLGGMARSRGVLEPEHPIVEGLRAGLAQVLTAQGGYPAAFARFDSVYVNRIARHGGDHPGVVFILVRWGDALVLAGRLDEAAARLQEAVDMGTRLSREPSVYRALALEGLARIALARGRLSRAEELVTEAEELAAELLRPTHRYTLAIARTRARLLLARGRPAEAETLLRTVLAGEAEVRPEPHTNLAETLVLIGEARLARGDDFGARDALYRARANQVQLPGDHPEVVRTGALLRRALGTDAILGSRN